MANLIISFVSNKRIFLSFALVILMGSLLLESALCPASKLKQQAISSTSLQQVSMVCVTGLFTQ